MSYLILFLWMKREDMVCLCDDLFMPVKYYLKTKCHAKVLYLREPLLCFSQKNSNGRSWVARISLKFYGNWVNIEGIRMAVCLYVIMIIKRSRLDYCSICLCSRLCYDFNIPWR